MVTALGKKLLRDLSRLKGQAVTIALVVASGIASYVAFEGAYRALSFAQTSFYGSHRFGEVFAHLERAPRSVAADLASIPGVAVADVRVVEAATLPMPDMPEPVVAQIVGLPHAGPPRLNDVHIRRGRLPDPDRSDEVVVLESFARAHTLDPGDTVPVVVNGVLREYRVAGTAMSPEYVFPVSGREPFADDRRVAVLWMREDVLLPSYRMEGAFNDVALALEPGANERAVLVAVDALLDRYGGLGAFARKNQPSHTVLAGELEQLEVFATVVPAIFLGVAVLLVYIVLTRLVHLQRSQIATLKALGYEDRTIALHYVALVAVITAIGAAIGLGAGAFLGRGMTRLYADYFRFPRYDFRVEPEVVIRAMGASVAAAFAGALTAVRGAVRLPPAEAMRPEAPPRYRRSIADRLGLARVLGAAAMMVVRELSRRPARAGLYVVGIATAVACLVGARFGYDAMDVLFDVQFETASREDLLVTFRRERPGAAAEELAHLPGVVAVEPQRSAPVRFRSGHVYRDTVITGHPEGERLRRLVEHPPRAVTIPSSGLVLTAILAERLGVQPGDEVDVEFLSGQRQQVRLVVVGVSRELFGMSGHMSLHTLHELLGEEPVLTGAALSIERDRIQEVERRLKEMPEIGSVLRREALLELFRKQTAETMWVSTLILTLFATTIAVGIVYNSARVALSTRERDLASLRVLGFTRHEIAAILLGEIAVYVVSAVPLGLCMGYGLTELVARMMDPELYRLEVDTSAKTWAFAVAVTLGSAVVSALLVRRRIDRLDLVAVLKTRE